MKTKTILVFFLIAACCLWVTCIASEEKSYPDPERFEKAVKAFEEQDKLNPPPSGAVLCIGSSSMKRWHGTIKDDLSPLTVIPRGFGGSNWNDLIHYTDRIVIPYKPRAILIYEGDNDIAAGISPEEVFAKFKAFVKKAHKELPKARLYILAIKPSIRRASMWPDMAKANALIEKECSKDDLLTYIDIASPMLDASGKVKDGLLTSDDLHMNEKGYEIWTKVVRPILVKKERAFEK